jgi:hypothetical protein
VLTIESRRRNDTQPILSGIEDPLAWPDAEAVQTQDEGAGGNCARRPHCAARWQRSQAQHAAAGAETTIRACPHSHRGSVVEFRRHVASPGQLPGETTMLMNPAAVLGAHKHQVCTMCSTCTLTIRLPWQSRRSQSCRSSQAQRCPAWCQNWVSKLLLRATCGRRCRERRATASGRVAPPV